MNKLVLTAKIARAALCSESTKSFYDRIAEIYDCVFTDHVVHAEKIVDILSQGRSSENKALVLDLGCGTGLVSKALCRRGFRVIGLDISFQSLKVLQHANQQIMPVQGDMESLPLKDNALGAISCLGVWRHLANPEIVIAEASRILRRGGTFALGYFPPKLGGLLFVPNTGALGRLVALMYSRFVRLMGYNDRVQRSSEEDALQLLSARFKNVYKVESGKRWYLIVASGCK